MNIERKTELLAPAGRPDALRAAVQNGADAIYLGEKEFSARKNAANFSWDELKQAVLYCHTRSVKVHLALNTLISCSELKSFEKTVVKAAECGVDAVIVQDLGAADIIKHVCPKLLMHASTQMTACNIYDAEALSEAGFSRIVLSRELSAKEITEISRNTDAELEAFVHGALCISFSGKCLMSSFIGGRSGNRGMCAQPCRQLYRSEGKSGYLLSPRDLCLAGYIGEMADAGITSFKIEGRMKSPEYVAVVTGIYRKYIDSKIRLTNDDEDKLKKIFVRGDGFTNGYFKEYNTPAIMNYSISNDNLSSAADEKILREARASFREGVENRKIPVHGELIAERGNASVFTLSDFDGNTVCVSGAEPSEAINLPLTEKMVSDRMKKLGQTPFEMTEMNAVIADNIMISAAELNRLRRDASALLEKKRSQPCNYEIFGYSYPPLTANTQKRQYIAAQIMSKQQFDAVSDADIVLIPIYLWNSIDIDERCAAVLPPVVLAPNGMLHILEKINPPKGVYVSSLGMARLVRECGHTANADYGMNLYNSVAVNSVSDIFSAVTLSPELSLQDINIIAKHSNVPCEITAYGYQSVMTSRACLIRGIRGKCDCTNPLMLRDKTGAVFTIYGDENTHLNTVVNSRPTFMADKLSELKKCGAKGLRLVFTCENADEVRKITAMYKGKETAVKPKIYTRGYFMK